MSELNRRFFLKQSAVAGGLLALPQLANARVAPQDQVNLGFIGLGGRGGRLLKEFSALPGVNVAGLCDPDSELCDKHSAAFPEASTCADLRQLLDDLDVDAVVITACNHWHCLAALWAMEAGKHVYVEKPLCNAHWEGQQVVKATNKYGKVCQIGTQQRTAEMQAEIKRLLHDEQVLGPPQWVRVNRFGVRQSIGKRQDPLSIPSNIDYDLWLGPANDQPIYRDRLHYDWHWDWNTGGGEMGNWGVHILDDVRNNVFQDRIAFPKRVVAAGGRYGWHDAGNTPNTHFALLDTGDIPVVITLTNLPAELNGDQPPACPGPSSGYVVYCDGGRVEGQRGHARLVDADGKLIKEIPGNDGMGEHQQNFVDAIRNDSPSALNAPVEMGHHSTAWCNLANYSYRVAQEQPHADSDSWTDILQQMPLHGVRPAQIESLCDELNQIANLHEPEAASIRLLQGPVLQFDASSETFMGDHADVANQHLRTAGRGKFVVKEVKAPTSTIAS
ncbi:MAG: Gfo/Idh/MocA family oxidoreductase [Planctomycetota bacterium]